MSFTTREYPLVQTLIRFGVVIFFITRGNKRNWNERMMKQIQDVIKSIETSPHNFYYQHIKTKTKNLALKINLEVKSKIAYFYLLLHRKNGGFDLHIQS